MRILERAFDFDDVLILPKRSSLPSRKNVELTRDFVFKHSGLEWNGFPVIASNMYNTGSINMAHALSEQLMCTALCKHLPADTIINLYNFYHLHEHVFYTMGISDEDLDVFNYVMDRMTTPIEIVVVDVANGYQQQVVEFVRHLRKQHPCLTIFVGNVVSGDMTSELILAGADGVKVGIGPSAYCKTRVVTGVGMPQLTAIMECADAAHGLGGHIIADGGVNHIGDISKAIGAGADFVMIGGLFMGYDENDGEWVVKDGVKYLKTFGMSSIEAQDKFNGGLATHRASEGRSMLKPALGPITPFLKEIRGGVASTCTYVGAPRLKDLSKCTTFVQVNNTHNRNYE